MPLHGEEEWPTGRIGPFERFNGAVLLRTSGYHEPVANPFDRLMMRAINLAHALSKDATHVASGLDLNIVSSILSIDFFMQAAAEGLDVGYERSSAMNVEQLHAPADPKYRHLTLFGYFRNFELFLI